MDERLQTVEKVFSDHVLAGAAKNLTEDNKNILPSDAREILAQESLLPITSFQTEDVFMVAYPKSGNTWLQNLTAGIIYGVIPEYAPPLLAHYDLIPDVHFKHFYKRYSDPMFFKSHHLPKPEYRRVIYLLRDGRDVMVSYFHYLLALGQEVDFLQLVQTGQGLFPSKWHEHVEAWLANPFNATMMIIKYEDLQKNAVSELQRICSFLGVQRRKSFLKQMTRSASFHKLREKEATVGMGTFNPNWRPDRFFFRRGKVGSFRDEMSETVLTAFLKEGESTLKKSGYL
ncbi:MAG: sulfotransferase domain-containing protein [Verrucomicrobiota bacterium]|nr:sulfotransferase domain-containing protein [Verrucomicrobiota bacterium]